MATRGEMLYFQYAEAFEAIEYYSRDPWSDLDQQTRATWEYLAINTDYEPCDRIREHFGG